MWFTFDSRAESISRHFRAVQKHSVLSRHFSPHECHKDWSGVVGLRIFGSGMGGVVLASILLCAFASTSKQILRKHFHYSNLSSSSQLLGCSTACLPRCLIWLSRPPFITFTAGCGKAENRRRHAASDGPGWVWDGFSQFRVYPGNEPQIIRCCHGKRFSSQFIMATFRLPPAPFTTFCAFNLHGCAIESLSSTSAGRAFDLVEHAKKYSVAWNATNRVYWWKIDVVSPHTPYTHTHKKVRLKSPNNAAGKLRGEVAFHLPPAIYWVSYSLRIRKVYSEHLLRLVALSIN